MGRPLGSRNKKSIWLLQSLAEHGYDYEKMLTRFLEKAAKGDAHAERMAYLLVKMVPYLANTPKTDAGQVQIETLVIARLDRSDKVHAIDTTATDGHPPVDAALDSDVKDVK